MPDKSDPISNLGRPPFSPGFRRLLPAIPANPPQPSSPYRWLSSGRCPAPIFGFNDTWQLVINTSTTIITFLMVVVIQNSQNRDTAAMQIKLDELLSKVGMT